MNDGRLEAILEVFWFLLFLLADEADSGVEVVLCGCGMWRDCFYWEMRCFSLKSSALNSDSFEGLDKGSS